MKASPKLKIGIIIVFLTVFFVILNLTGLTKELKNFFYLTSSPIQKVFWQAGKKISDFGESIFKIKILKSENEKLLLKNQELLAEIAQLQEVKKENEILRTALEIGLEKEFKLVLSQVIGKDVLEDFILINKGSKDGIQKDFPVITQQKVLFGKIDEVYKNFSKIMLISNKKSVFDAKIQISNTNSTLPGGNPDATNQDIFGVVKGKGNLQLFFDLIPSNAEIKEDAILITSALGGTFPKGLLVGEIKKVEKSDIKPFQQAEIKPFFDISWTEELFIILEW